MMKTTMKWWRSALTVTRQAAVAQVRRGPQSLSWHPPAAAADDEAPWSSKCPATPDAGQSDEARPMSDLEGPTGWPIVGNFLSYLKKENQGQMHIVQMELHRKFGKMFREKWGANWQLHICDADVIEQVYRREGRYPHRPGLSAWMYYMQSTGRPHGLFIAQGEEWKRQRQVLGAELLSRDMFAKLSEPISAVTDDFITRLRDARDRSGDRALVDKLPDYVYRWTLEASGSFLFETRLGCLQAVVPARTCQFIDAIHQMMDSSLFLIVGDHLHRTLNTSYWRRHKQAWDQLFSIATELVDERLASLKENDNNHSGLFLTCLLRKKDIAMPEIYSNMLDLLIAGTDTTANTYCFLVYLLAHNVDVQQRAYDEIREVMRNQQQTDTSSSSLSSSSAAAAAADPSQFKYLNCVIKEALRIYPPVTMNCRILDEDNVIGGYLIPKQTLIVMNHFAASRDSQLFDEPDKFQPERWMRSSTRTQPQKHPFASLPFGSGSRSCIGRRIALAELTTILVKTLTNFRLEMYPGVEFRPKLRTLLTPGDHVPVRFVDRSLAD